MPNTKARYRIFVSYSRKDSALVSTLVRFLMVADDRVFQDVHDIEPGSRWRAVITMAIDSCDKMLLFWCAHSSSSSEVGKEYSSALRRKKILVPVLLDDTDLPAPLSNYQAIDLRAALGTHKEGAPATAPNARGKYSADESRDMGELAAIGVSTEMLKSAADRLRAGLAAVLFAP